MPQAAAKIANTITGLPEKSCIKFNASLFLRHDIFFLFFCFILFHLWLRFSLESAAKACTNYR
jgi:hypothetical protein